MVRLTALSLALLFATAAAPTADAQLGRLLNRAKEAVTGTAEAATEAVQAATPGASGASPSDPSPATLDGRPAPVMDYLSMMNTGYVLRDGYWYDGDHYLVFYPGGEAAAQWTVTNAAGRTLYAEDIRLSSTGDATFTAIRAPRFMSRDNLPPADGEFALNVVIDGHLVGHIPYTVQTTQAGDAYNSRTEYRRVDGPWARLAYFTHDLRRPEENIEFHGWLRNADMPAGENKVRVTLYRDGEPVAACNVRNCPRPGGLQNDWTPIKTKLGRFAVRDESNPDRGSGFAITDVQPGAYEVRVTGFDSGTLIHRYALTGAAGAFQEHPRSAMSYEPRYNHLSPRTVRGTSGGSGTLQFNQTYWMDAAE